MSDAFQVDVQYANAPRAGQPDDAAIRRWAGAALAGRRDAAQLVVRIVDEAEGRELNANYRGRDGATNVLSFDFGEPDLLDPPLLGDIVVCAPVVEREAQEQGKAPEAHWAHLVVHGVLHLLGFDHEDESEAERMEGIEREVLAGLGYPDPYASERGAVDDPRPLRAGA